MKADTLKLKDLFQKEVRYVIPTFQRPYVWNQDDQWEPLWEDVRNAAERYIDALVSAEGNGAKAEELTGTHFMGAVVLQQQPNAAKDLETRDVIDGQQRLTTMQLLVDAAQHVMERLGEEAEAKALARLVTNHFASGDHTFKLWPTSLDRDAFRAAMTNEADVRPFHSSQIVKAHEFFQLQIEEWILASPDEEARASRLNALETTLFGLLELVVIDLASDDDAYVIFETLNARGTPLLASDLVKNFLLQTAQAKGLSSEAIYEEDWKQLESDWWRKEVRQGRITRPRLDQFLNYWLVMRTADEVPSNDVFPRFKDFVEEGAQPIDSVARELSAHGAVFRSLEDIDPQSEEGTFLYRWRTIEAGVSTPLLLWLFAQGEDVLTSEDRLACLKALESYLVRRMLCRLTTKDYNRMFLELLTRTKKAEPGSVPEAFIGYLAAQTSESRFWPTDLATRGAVLDLPLYRLLTRGRLRMVLEALEDDRRTKYAEAGTVVRGKLTIEHILPQSWQANWPLPEEKDPVVASMERDRRLHTLGNLTLVNDKLNPGLSNSGWSTKREALAKYSILHLNKDLLAEYGASEFSDGQIYERGESLADRIVEIWPGGPPPPA